MDLLLPAIGLLMLWGTIELSIMSYRRRSKMTPEEREAEDNEMRIW